MKKRSVIIGALLVVVCMLTLVACNNTDTGTEGQSSTAEELYAQAVAYGYEGTLAEFLATLKGDSAYDIAVKNGFEGTEAEWLLSLKGEKGDDGVDGSASERGDSAYEIAVKNGFTGTEEEWLSSLKGADGENGKDGQNW